MSKKNGVFNMVSKKKINKTNVMRILDQHKIPYESFEFPWSEDHLEATEVADKLGFARDDIFKTLVAKGDKTGVIVACIPGNAHLDLKKLAKASGNKKVEMLHMKDLEATTGYIRGGCSPIGMKKLFPTYIGEQATAKENILISAGKRGVQVALDPNVLTELVFSKFVAITE